MVPVSVLYDHSNPLPPTYPTTPPHERPFLGLLISLAGGDGWSMSITLALGRFREGDCKSEGLTEEDPVSIKWLLLTVLTSIMKYFSTIAIDNKQKSN